jgi:N-acetyl-anhydromuramyl-L-alanine amidase AmpD
VLAHSDIAPQRKQDPGELFNWEYLADQGIGISPRLLADGMENTTNNAMQLLKEIGYEIPDPLTDESQYRLIRAFQMHYYPEAELGILCDETQRRIANLMYLIKSY